MSLLLTGASLRHWSSESVSEGTSNVRGTQWKFLGAENEDGCEAAIGEDVKLGSIGYFGSGGTIVMILISRYICYSLPRIDWTKRS